MHVCIYVCVCMCVLGVYARVYRCACQCTGMWRPKENVKCPLSFFSIFLRQSFSLNLELHWQYPLLSLPPTTQGFIQLYVWVLGFKFKSSSLYSKCLSTGPPLLVDTLCLLPSLSFRQYLVYPRLLSNSLYS